MRIAQLGAVCGLMGAACVPDPAQAASAQITLTATVKQYCNVTSTRHR